uniref:HD/PDEase domain-containing protein n=1 Tax=Myripristis murdjan TaxID=586833 RepID=A0A667Z8U7_9TELE
MLWCVNNPPRCCCHSEQGPQPIVGRLQILFCVRCSVFSQVFNDPIHGHMEIHPLLVKFIDTPQFQRLRNIKQLGAAYYVYPGASHNRFEHSIGYVCFLQALRDRQPDLDITDEDILCVQIAGLCHDLGHGPFSHLFDGRFIPEIRKHEDASKMMFDHMVEVNELKKEMEKYKLDKDLEFIKQLIDGPLAVASVLGDEQGRGEVKYFLYEIVANKTNGIDVDKWDYLARDCHHLGIPMTFDYRRLLMFTRVCEVDGLRHICIRDKEAANLYDMFYRRFSLHQRAYQHRVNNIIAYIVFDQILSSSDDNLKGAKEILNKIVRRQIYRYLGKIPSKVVTRLCSCVFLCLCWCGHVHMLSVVTLDYGMRGENPIDEVYFYSKRNPDEPYRISKEEVSKLLPSDFNETFLRVYWKGEPDDANLERAKEIFNQWCARNFPLLQIQYVHSTGSLKGKKKTFRNLLHPNKPVLQLACYGTKLYLLFVLSDLHRIMSPYSVGTMSLAKNK